MTDKSLKYPPELKKEAVEFALKYNNTKAAEVYGLTRKTVRKWVGMFKERGSSSFFVKRRRDDMRSEKISDGTLNEIIRLKQEDPDITLKQIKKIFRLNCSLQLISYKLRSASGKPGKHSQKIVVSYKRITSITQRTPSGKGSFYQFNIYDTLNDVTYFGFSFERNVRSLCVFLNRVICSMNATGELNDDAVVSSNLKYLKQLSRERSYYDNIIRNEYDLPLVIENNKKLIKGKIKKFKNPGCLNELVESAYENMILGEGKTRFVTPLVENAYIQDIQNDPAFSAVRGSRLLISAVEKIEKYGDEARINFDYDRAGDLYQKIYLTAEENGREEWNELRLKALYKMMLIFYHFKDYKNSKELIEKIIQDPHKEKMYVLGDIYNHLGLIYFYMNQPDNADKYFTFSLNYFLDRSKNKYIFDYYRVYIRKKINSKSFYSALVYAKRYIQTAINHKNILEKCRAYDIKGVVYFYLRKFKLAENNFKKQLSYARQDDNPIEEVKALNSLLGIYSLEHNKSESEINEMISRIRFLSKKIKKESLYYDIIKFKANYYYKLGLYSQAASEYSKAAKSALKYNDKYNYIRNLYFLALSEYFDTDTDSSIKNFKHVCNISGSADTEYCASAHYYIGRVLMEKAKYSSAVYYFNRSRKILRHDNKNIIVADSLKCTGMILEQKKEKTKALNFYRRSVTAYRKHLKTRLEYNATENISYIEERIRMIN